MTEELETGFDPEHIFNEGQVAGQLDLQEQLGARLQDELGLTPEETQALFDPAPRKGKKRGKVNCSAKQWAKMPQICKQTGRPIKAHHARHAVRSYDPAPGKVTQAAHRVKRRTSGMVNKVLPYVPVLVGAGAFWSLYSARATELKTAGKLNSNGTPVNGVIDAIMYDINNYTANGGTTGSIDRIKANLPTILGSLIGGFAIGAATKGTKYSKYGDVANKSLMAYGAAVGLKAILDPPLNSGQPVRQQPGQVTIVDQNRLRSQEQVMQLPQTLNFSNPY